MIAMRKSSQVLYVYSYVTSEILTDSLDVKWHMIGWIEWKCMNEW